MRIRFDATSIIEAYDVNAVIGGLPDKTKENEYIEMSAYLDVYTHAWPNRGDGDYDENLDMTTFGEFDVSDCHTFEDAERKIAKFFDDLLVNGYVDIGTEEKCKAYHFTIF